MSGIQRYITSVSVTAFLLAIGWLVDPYLGSASDERASQAAPRGHYGQRAVQADPPPADYPKVAIVFVIDGSSNMRNPDYFQLAKDGLLAFLSCSTTWRSSVTSRYP